MEGERTLRPARNDQMLGDYRCEVAHRNNNCFNAVLVEADVVVCLRYCTSLDPTVVVWAARRACVLRRRHPACHPGQRCEIPR